MLPAETFRNPPDRVSRAFSFKDLLDLSVLLRSEDLKDLRLSKT